MTESTTATATAIPTEHAALVAHLRDLPDRDRARVAELLAAQLREDGHPAPLAMAGAMVDRAAAEIKDDPAEPIPTDVYRLAEHLRPLDAWGRTYTADRLAAQLGNTPSAIDRAADLTERALQVIAHDDLVDQLRAHLAEQLDTAAAAVQAARNTIDRLAAPDVYDVEYAEGAYDMRDFLDGAGRNVRAARALNPVQPDKPTGGA